MNIFLDAALVTLASLTVILTPLLGLVVCAKLVADDRKWWREIDE